jgi:hypothetical protein
VLGGAIERILGDPELGRRLAAAAAPIPQREYSLKAAGERLEAIYRPLLEENR